MNWKLRAAIALGLLLIADLSQAHPGENHFCHANGAPCHTFTDTAKTPEPPEPDECADKPTAEEQCECMSEGKPVSVSSGREYLKRTDLVVKGVYPIALERRYSSHAAYDSPLGYGWAFGHDMALYEYPDDNPDEVIVRTGCGVRNRFVPTNPQTPDGTFVSPSGFRAELTKSGSDYTVRFSGGKKAHFSASAGEGTLSALEDAHGNQLEFDYDPPGPGRAPQPDTLPVRHSGEPQ